MTQKNVPPAMRRAVGDEGEEIACRYLAEKGYTILRRNFKGRHGEIDIIAAKGEYLIFAEVKTRTLSAASPYGRPAAAVTKEKQRHIIAAAEEYLLKDPSPAESVRFMRFDVLEIVRSRASLPAVSSVTHFEGAFTK